MKKERRNPSRKPNSPFSLKERFQYWFDNRMSKGSLGLIRTLIVSTVALAILIAALIILFGFNEKGEIASVFWDSIATVINAWMPSFEDGSPGYLIMMSVSALAGVLFTSVLIGIFTSAIEEKIENLKRGNSLVLEKGHIVVLGFYPGEYALLKQLILAAADEPSCIVVAEDMEREMMVQSISENIDVPKNIRIVCRTVDITDPVSIEKCSVETCRTVIISPTDDMRTIKAVLAVSALLEEKGVPEISVNAIISKSEHRFPPSIAETNNIATVETNKILAKMIAHSCTQTGLSETFREIYNYEGSEYYIIDVDGIDGLKFEELMTRLNSAVPAGVCRDGKIILNPSAGYELSGSDKILVFSEEKHSAKLEPSSDETFEDAGILQMRAEDETDTVIIGYNETLPILLQELPDNISHVYLVGQKTTEQERENLQKVADARNMALTYYRGSPQSPDVLLELAQMAEHIVILNDHDQEPEEADMFVIFLILNLRDIRTRYNLDFNITAEMQKEYNQKLIGYGDHTDFLVSSSMSSLILAQLAESPELVSVFRELLSNRGNELYLKNVGLMQLEGEYSVRRLRQIMLKQGYILLGDLDSEKRSHFNRQLDERIVLTKDDSLIVIGEEY